MFLQSHHDKPCQHKTDPLGTFSKWMIPMVTEARVTDPVAQAIATHGWKVCPCWLAVCGESVLTKVTPPHQSHSAPTPTGSRVQKPERTSNVPAWQRRGCVGLLSEFKGGAKSRRVLRSISPCAGAPRGHWRQSQAAHGLPDGDLEPVGLPVAALAMHAGRQMR